VQGLDGEAHRNRKQMFMLVMTKENIEQLAGLTATCGIRLWRDGLRQAATVLYDEIKCS
jgi:fatty-acid peroxygenase